MLQVLRQEIIKSGESNIQQPVNLKRLLWNAQRVFEKEQSEGKTQSSKLGYTEASPCILFVTARQGCAAACST